ncbi:hypothetical protein, partial [Gloeocapsopsis dulcis]|uniref:hypothetical protein n=1 Tax=Gloeocapsopsis dulcis TaxID=2859516 RepID=UPI0019D537F9
HLRITEQLPFEKTTSRSKNSARLTISRTHLEFAHLGHCHCRSCYQQFPSLYRIHRTNIVLICCTDFRTTNSLNFRLFAKRSCNYYCTIILAIPTADIYFVNEDKYPVTRHLPVVFVRVISNPFKRINPAKSDMDIVIP